MKSKIFTTSLMLLLICSVLGSQEEFDHRVHLLFEDQPNLLDQRFQDDLERRLFACQQSNLGYKKIRDFSLIYNGVSFASVLLFFVTCEIVQRLKIHDSLKETPFCIFFLPSLLFPVTISLNIWTAWKTYITDLQIEQFEQKLAEHRLKMASLGKCCFTTDQIEQFEQKLEEMKAKMAAA